MITLVYPFPSALWPVAWEWLAPVRQIVCDDYAPKEVGAYVELALRKECRAIGIAEDGHLVGVVTFDPVNPATVLMHVLFRRWFRGTARTGAAARLACAKVFEEPGVRKILALIPADNRLAIALALRGGGTVEGVLREHTMRNGKPLDAVAVGITREEFANGTGFRRIVRKQQEHLDRQRNGDGHVERDGGHDLDVRGTPGCAPIDALKPVRDAVAGDAIGRTEPKRKGGGSRRGKPDQQSGAGVKRPHEFVPRVTGVRAKRADGPVATLKRTGKAKLTGGKPKQRSRNAASAKSANAR